MLINYEFKARCSDPGRLEEKLKQLGPLFIGTDRQVDTYFHVSEGRLKLREGNIENALIHYRRTDIAGAKRSDVTLYPHAPHPGLKDILAMTLGIRAIVDKKRNIYFIGNVKFHFDEVEGLGSFVEVEAIDSDGSLGMEQLKQQCDYYRDFLNIDPEQFIAESYSDLVLAKNSSST